MECYCILTPEAGVCGEVVVVVVEAVLVILGAAPALPLANRLLVLCQDRIAFIQIHLHHCLYNGEISLVNHVIKGQYIVLKVLGAQSILNHHKMVLSSFFILPCLFLPVSGQK